MTHHTHTGSAPTRPGTRTAVTWRIPRLGWVSSRVSTAIALGGVVLAGLVVTRFGAGPWADSTGDALYAAMAVLLVRLIAPQVSIRRQASIGLGWCWLVEFAQLTGVPAAVVAQVPLARLVLGTTFVPVDLLAYVVGALVCAAVIGLSSGGRIASRTRSPES